jgi:hypothetical protein
VGVLVGGPFCLGRCFGDPPFGGAMNGLEHDPS